MHINGISELSIEILFLGGKLHTLCVLSSLPRGKVPRDSKRVCRRYHNEKGSAAKGAITMLPPKQAILRTSITLPLISSRPKGTLWEAYSAM